MTRSKKSMSEEKKEEFPYEGFPVKLEHKEGKVTKTLYFEHEDDMKKYMTRYKINKKESTISIKKEKK